MGFYPKKWKECLGVMLAKPDKPNYLILKAYRIISLLNCLGKVLERIIANRLGYLADITNLH